MSQPDQGPLASPEEQLVALLDDPDFVWLSAEESKFNIFDALGTRRQEIRHSDFLAYVLDPRRPHGLGDRFLRDFLIIATQPNTYPPFDKVSLRLAALDEVTVDRELLRVDILIQNPQKWAVLIENKIGASEHGDQLSRYRELVPEKLGGVPALLLYLTPDGEAPSDDNWIPISHTLTCHLARKWSASQNVPERTAYALKDYADFLEAHVLEDTKTAELCRKIYRRHREAVDLLIRHVPTPRDFALEAAQEAVDRLEAKGLIVLDTEYHKVSRFYPSVYADSIPLVAPAESWTQSRKGLLFEWELTSKRLRLDLTVGPVDTDRRDKILSAIFSTETDEIEFNQASRKNKSFSHVRKRVVLNFDDIEEFLVDDGQEELVSDIGKVIEEELRLTDEAIRAASRI